jgi:hypothetical protein
MEGAILTGFFTLAYIFVLLEICKLNIPTKHQLYKLFLATNF